MTKTFTVCLALLLFASTANATLVTYETTHLGGTGWRYDYSVTNDSLGSDIFELTIFFELGSYANLTVASSPVDWDSLVIQPDPGLPDDGFFDTLALGAPLAALGSLGGFAVEFLWLGAGSPGAQAFAVVDPDTFATLDSGLTTLVQTPTPVPVPATLWLLTAGLAALAGAVRRRSNRHESSHPRATVRGCASQGAAALALVLGAAGAFMWPHTADAAAQVTGIQLVGSARFGRTEFDYTYRLTIANGNPALTNASVAVTSSSGAIVVVDGSVQAGTLAANANTTPTDTFVVRVDRTVAFNPAALSYTVAGTPVGQISGVAAVGTPLAGIVTVKDAAGTTRTVPIGTNGSYSVNVSDLIAPFVFRAEGTANGHTYTVYSAATAGDVEGGNINITQLTDLAIANIARQVAGAYFDAGDFSTLTADALNEEIELLTDRLRPVLLALGVDAGIDLLRSRFTPLQSPLDAALDILRVSYDDEVAANTATIYNIVTQQRILDDLTIPAAAEVNPPAMTDTGNVSQAAGDIAAIRTMFANFSAQFAGGLPPPAIVEAFFSASYLDNDEGRDEDVSEIVSDTSLAGASFTGVDVTSIDYGDPFGITAAFDFTVEYAEGDEDERVTGWAVRREEDGVWRFYGNQRVLDIEVGDLSYRGLSYGDCRTSGLSFDIDEHNPTNNGGAIHHLNVFGPGLPAAGLRFVPPPLAGANWVIAGTPGGGFFRMAETCGPGLLGDTVIAAIPDNATYYLVAYTSVDDSARLDFPSGAIAAPGELEHGAYSMTVRKRPLTRAELLTTPSFPVITAPATAAQFSAYAGGPLAIAASNLKVNPDERNSPVILEYRSRLGAAARIDADLVPTSLGTISTTLELLPLTVPGDTFTYRSLRIVSGDGEGRRLMTGYEEFGSTVGGTVSGLSGSVTLRLNWNFGSGLNAALTTVDTSGAFRFNPLLPDGVGYGVGIATLPDTQICAVVANSPGLVNGDINNVAVTCRDYSVGGTVSGLTGSGLTLRINGGNDLAVPVGSPSFAFPSVSLRGPGGVAAPYSVSIRTQPVGQTCTILNAAGTIPFAAPNVTGVNVTCVANVTDALSGTYRAVLDGATPVTDRALITFYPDGTYIFAIHGHLDPGCAPGDTPNLVQYGVYRYTQGTGELALDLAYQTPQRCGGFDDDTPRGQFTVLGTATKNPDGTLVIEASDGTFTFAPVTSIAGTLIGSWGNNQFFEVFGADGTLFHATTLAIVQNSATSPGIEDGCYLLSGTTESGSFTTNFGATCAVNGVQTGVDTTGTATGYSFWTNLGIPVIFTVSGDSRSVFGGPPLMRITPN